MVLSFFRAFTSSFRRADKRKTRKPHAGRPHHKAMPLQVEALEERRVPTLVPTVFWDGAGQDARWDNPLNWHGDVLPGLSDFAAIRDPGTTIVIDGDVRVAGFVSDAPLRIDAGNFAFADGYLPGLTLSGGSAQVLDHLITGELDVNRGTLATADTSQVVVTGPGQFNWADTNFTFDWDTWGDLTIGAAGNLLGAGSVHANLFNHGSVNLGTEILTIEGNYIQAGTGVLKADVSNPQSGQLRAAGTVILGGKFVVQVDDGAVQSPGNTFAVVQATALEGTFDAVTGLEAGDNIDYQADGVSLELDLAHRQFQFPAVAAEVERNGSVVLAGIHLGGPQTQEVELLLMVNHGTLEVTREDDEVAVQDNGSGLVSFFGTVRGLNAVLPTLVYHPSADFTGLDTLQGELTASGRTLTRSAPIAVHEAVPVVTPASAPLQAILTTNVLPFAAATVRTVQEPPSSSIVSPPKFDAGGPGGGDPGAIPGSQENPVGEPVAEDVVETQSFRMNYNLSWFFRILEKFKPARRQPEEQRLDPPPAGHPEEIPDDGFAIFPEDDPTTEPAFSLTDSIWQPEQEASLLSGSGPWSESFLASTTLLFAAIPHWPEGKKAKKYRKRLRVVR